MTADDTTPDRAKIRARAEAATPGPWRYTDSEVVDDVWVDGLAIVGPDRDPVAVVADEWYESDEGEPTPFHDAAHIAGMDPATTIALLDALDRAEAQLQ